MAAFIGGLAGALVVYFSDEKRVKILMDKFEEIFNEGKEKESEIKDKIDKSIKDGSKILAKKIH